MSLAEAQRARLGLGALEYRRRRDRRVWGLVNIRAVTRQEELTSGNQHHLTKSGDINKECARAKVTQTRAACLAMVAVASTG